MKLEVQYNKDTDYLEYIAAIAANPLAREVKLADISHNTDLKRLARITDRDRARVLRYEKAKKLLIGGTQ